MESFEIKALEHVLSVEYALEAESRYFSNEDLDFFAMIVAKSRRNTGLALPYHQTMNPKGPVRQVTVEFEGNDGDDD